MKTRNRSRSRTVPGGVATWRSYNNPPTWYRTRRVARVYTEDMTDVIEKKKDIYGFLPVTDLHHRKSWAVGGPIRMYGRQTTVTGIRMYGLVAQNHASLVHQVPPSVHTAKDRGNSHYVTALLAKTNPYRPQFSIQVAIREMVELLSLFRITARTFAGFAGSAYLNYRFGWKALLNDLESALGVTKALESRLREFHSLQEGGIRRSKVFLDTYRTKRSFDPVLINSSPSPSSVRVTSIKTYHTEVYGSLRWMLAPGAWRVFEDLTPLQEFNHALRAVLDLSEISYATIWEVIPFSFLIDYFIEIGPYFEANRGFSVVEPHYTCITRRTRIEHTGDVISSPSYMRTAGNYQRITEITQRYALGHVDASFPTGLSPITWSEFKVILALLSKFKR